MHLQLAFHKRCFSFCSRGFSERLYSTDSKTKFSVRKRRRRHPYTVGTRESYLAKERTCYLNLSSRLQIRSVTKLGNSAHLISSLMRLNLPAHPCNIRIPTQLRLVSSILFAFNSFMDSRLRVVSRINTLLNQLVF